MRDEEQERERERAEDSKGGEEGREQKITKKERHKRGSGERRRERKKERWTTAQTHGMMQDSVGVPQARELAEGHEREDGVQDAVGQVQQALGLERSPLCH